MKTSKALAVIALMIAIIPVMGLQGPSTPYMVYGWVNDSTGSPVNDTTVTITNRDTGKAFPANTSANSNYYQLILANGTDVNESEVLQFYVTNGTLSNTSTRMVTQNDINNGGVFNYNLTLPPPAEAPTVDSITITPDDGPSEGGVQINPNAGNNKTVNISAVVSDPDGWGNINTVEAVIAGPGTVADSPVTLNLTSHDTTTATFNGTFNMTFYYANGTYTVNVTATDDGGLTGSRLKNFTYKTCIGLSIDADVINFGTVDPGENSTVAGDKDMGTLNNATVRNIGNVIIDVEVNGMDMTYNGNVIIKDNIEARINEKLYQDLSSARCFDVNMSIGESILENADFKLYVPYGTPQGGYSGTITLTAKTC